MKKAYAKKGRKFISKLSLELELQVIFIFFLFILFVVPKRKLRSKTWWRPDLGCWQWQCTEMSCAAGRTNSSWFLVCAVDTGGMNEWAELGKVMIAALAILPSLWFWTLPGSFPWSSELSSGSRGHAVVLQTNMNEDNCQGVLGNRVEDGVLGIPAF